MESGIDWRRKLTLLTEYSVNDSSYYRCYYKNQKHITSNSSGRSDSTSDSFFSSINSMSASISGVCRSTASILYLRGIGVEDVDASAFAHPQLYTPFTPQPLLVARSGMAYAGDQV